MGWFSKLVGGVVVVGVVVAGVKLVQKRKEEIKAQKPPAVYPLRLPLYTPTEGVVEVTLPAVGVVKSTEEVKVASKYSGRLRSVKGLGEEVKKGEVVAVVDPTPVTEKLRTIEASIGEVKAQLAGDRARLQTLQRSYSRTRELIKVHLASQSDLDRLEGEIAQLTGKIRGEEARLAGLEASRKSTLHQLSYTEIEAPISGQISSRFLNPGELVTPGKPILGITPPTGSYLELPLPTSAVGILYRGKRLPLYRLGRTQNSLPLYWSPLPDPLPAGELVPVRVLLYRGPGYLLPPDTLLPRGGEVWVVGVDQRGVKPVKVEVVAKGSEGVVVKGPLPPQIVKGGADLLLQLIAGRPFAPLRRPESGGRHPGKGASDV